MFLCKYFMQILARTVSTVFHLSKHHPLQLHKSMTRKLNNVYSKSWHFQYFYLQILQKLNNIKNKEKCINSRPSMWSFTSFLFILRIIFSSFCLSQFFFTCYFIMLFHQPPPTLFSRTNSYICFCSFDDVKIMLK